MRPKKIKLQNDLKINKTKQIRQKNILKRNREIQLEFVQLYKQNPNLRYDVMLEMLSDRYYLSAITLHRILKKDF